MTLGVGAAAAVLVGAVVLSASFLRLPSNQVGGGPSTNPDGSTPVAAAAICEFFAEGGPESVITTPATIPAMAFPSSPPSESPQAAAEAIAKALAAPIDATIQFAERVSGVERDDVLALAATMAGFAAALKEAAMTDPASADWTAINEELSVAMDRTLYGEHGPEAFYVKYGPACGQPLPVVDCGPLDEATCDRVVESIIANHRQGWEEGLEDQLPPDVPVLRVRIGPQGVTESGCVPEYEISWPGGGWVVQQSCADADPLPTPTAVVGSPDVGVPYLVVVNCTVDFPLGDTWWRFDNAGPTPEPVYEDLRGSLRAIVTLTSPDTAILRFADLPELMLSRVDEPIEASCVGV